MRLALNLSAAPRRTRCRPQPGGRARSIYGGGYAGGIYVDGGRDMVVERNVVSESDLGIEIGAENTGIVASGVVVRNNFVYRNDKAGLVFGGYDASVGRVRNSAFLNNTLFQNDTLSAGFGELWIQFADTNVVRNNLIYSTSQNVVLYSEGGNVDNTLGYDFRVCAHRARISSVMPAQAGIQPRRNGRTVRLGPGSRLSPGQASPG